MDALIDYLRDVPKENINRCISLVSNTYGITQDDCISILNDYYYDVSKKDEPRVPDIDDIQQPGEPLDYPSEKQMNTLSEYFKNDLNEYYKFRGSYIYEWGWLLYLQKQLPNDVLCAWKGKQYLTGRYTIGVYYFDEINKLKIDPWAVQSILDCKSRKNVRFVIGIMVIVTKIQDISGNFMRHANALIFDTKHKIVTRFEPHGSSANIYTPALLDRGFKMFLDTFDDGSWVYRAPVDYCPMIGPQMKEGQYQISHPAIQQVYISITQEPGGWCSVWALMYIHLRVINPELSDSSIVEHLDSMSDEELFNKVRQYAEFIVSKIEPDWVNKRKEQRKANQSYRPSGPPWLKTLLDKP